jgi:hypothetical protein
MIFEFDIFKKDEFIETLYVEYDCVDHTEEDFRNFILAAFMEFRTHCIIEGYDKNLYHFRNWMRKHKYIEFVTKPKSVSVRVDM